MNEVYDDKTISDSRLKERRDQWWNILWTVRRKFRNNDASDFDASDFDTWLLETYGVKIVYTSGGMISPEYEVVDEEKFILLLLKYT
jgi:hypothetical protein